MRMTNLRRALLVTVTAASLAACAQTGRLPPLDGNTAADIRSDVEQQMAESAARAANSLETLAMIQRARTAPAPSAIDESTLPPELARKATVEYTGPVAELVRELATTIGYAFLETGNRRGAPGMVSVDSRDISVAKVLEDAGLQVQAYATVIVDPNMKRIELRYESEARESGAARVARISAPSRPRRHRITVAPCQCGTGS